MKFICTDMLEANERTIGLLAVVAQAERRMISERTKAALAAAKARGVKLGNPNGVAALRADAATRWKGVEVRQAKADAFAERLRPVLDGMAAMSANATAAELDRLGYATARGVKWTARAVINVRGRLGTGAFS